MDTVYVDIEKHLELEVILNKLQSKGHWSGVKNQSGSGYQQNLSYRIFGHSVIVMHSPYRHNLPPMKLVFHLSKYRSLSAFIKWLSEVFDIREVQTILTSRLSRLDFCIDTLLLFNEIAEALDILNIKIRRSFKDEYGSKSAYYGKKPRVDVVYQKKVLGRDIVYSRGREKLDPERYYDATRIEFRLYNKKVPVKSISDLRGMESFNPFDRWKLYDLDELRKQNKSKSVDRFLDLISKGYCFKYAKSEFSVSRNFSKLVGKRLTEDKKLKEALICACEKKINKVLEMQVDKQGE